MSEPASNDELLQLRQTIARQNDEIARLQSRLEDERTAQDLKDALTMAAATSKLSAPVSQGRLLEMIVATAAQVISSNAASLLLIDEAAQDLVFEIALGQKADDVKKFHVPLGHGIAGLVAVTGQPMAISNAQNDARHASDISGDIGYQPQSILCVPLFYNDRITGVLELLDKRDKGNTITTFTPADIETLGHFANLAAVAIAQSRAQDNISGWLAQTLDNARFSTERTTHFLSNIEDDATYRRTLELADTVREIANYGEGETTACNSILRGFSEYLRLRPDALSSTRIDAADSGAASSGAGA